MKQPLEEGEVEPEALADVALRARQRLLDLRGREAAHAGREVPDHLLEPHARLIALHRADTVIRPGLPGKIGTVIHQNRPEKA